MTNRTFSAEAHAINYAADALRRHEMSGRILLPWEKISTGQRAKWIDKAQIVITAYKFPDTAPTSTERDPEPTRAALERLHKAVRHLGRSGSDGRALFEGSPIKDQECYEAWRELNDAQQQAHNALGRKLLFDNEWLWKKIEADPDVEVEAGRDLAPHITKEK